MSTPISIENPDGLSNEKIQEIEDHKRIASQLREAAQLHLAAANQLRSNDYVNAFQSIVSAYGIIKQTKNSQRFFLDNTLNGQTVL